jgi:hypothetical protein
MRCGVKKWLYFRCHSMRTRRPTCTRVSSSALKYHRAPGKRASAAGMALAVRDTPE